MLSTFSNIFSSETTGPIEAKFHMEPPWDRGTKVCSNGSGHMTKMAAMPIYGKNLKKFFFSGTKRLMTLKLGMQHWVLEYYQVCSDNDPGLTMSYFTARSIFSSKSIAASFRFKIYNFLSLFYYTKRNIVDMWNFPYFLILGQINNYFIYCSTFSCRLFYRKLVSMETGFSNRF